MKQHISRTWLVIQLMIVAALMIGYAAGARADILVRSSPAASATVPPNWSWQPPQNVIAAQTISGPWKLMAQVGDSERIATCYNDPDVVVGSQTRCDTRVPNRTDMWELKANLFANPPPVDPPLPPIPPPATGRVKITIEDTAPTYTDGTPAPRDQVAIRLYVGSEPISQTLLNAAPWAPRLTFTHEYPVTELRCFSYARIVGTEETARSDNVCSHSFAKPVVLKLTRPTTTPKVAAVPVDEWP
jgi:hypothetical protein